MPRRMSVRIQWALAVAGALALSACKSPPKPYAPAPPRTYANGLVVQTLRPGDGPGIEAGDKISVHFVGSLEDGGVFDNSRQRRAPFDFRVGRGHVIAGWDEGLLGAREGEVRLLTLPPELAYGSDSKKGIPPHSTLTFEIEILDVD